MKNLLKRIAVLLVIALLAPVVLPSVPMLNGLSNVEVYAASKSASVNLDSATIGIASSPEYIYIDNEKADAKYTITSKDKKIAKVNKYGEIIGVSLGKTTVNITEKYKGKVKTVGKVSITVVGPKFDAKEISIGVNDRRGIPIIYYNNKAKYTYKSSDSSIVKLDKYGLATGLKWGSADISVTETYKGKTTELGSIKVSVVPATISGDINESINVNNDTSLLDLIEYTVDNYNEKATYSAVSADPSIITCGAKKDSDGASYFALTGVKTGTTKVTIYEEYQDVKNEVGSISITVKEVPVESFELYKDYLDEVNKLPTIIYYLDDEESGYRELQSLFELEPYDTTTPITYVSGDTKIVTVDSEGIVTPKSAGTTKITVSCGSFTYDIQTIVKKTEE